MTCEGGEARRQIIEEALRRRPGLSFRRVCHVTHIPSGTTRHHLNVLVRQQRIWYTRVGPRLAHFAGAKPETEAARRDAVVATFDYVDSVLYRVARDEGPVPQKSMLDRFDGPLSTVQHRIKRLVRLGFLKECPQGRYKFYTVAWSP